MKKVILFLSTALVLISCNPSNDEVVKNYVEATNIYNSQKISEILSEDFKTKNGKTKKQFLNQLDTLKYLEQKHKILSIKDNDSVVVTIEQETHIFDSLLNIKPIKEIQRTYTIDNGLVKTVSTDSILNDSAYNKVYNEKMFLLSAFATIELGFNPNDENSFFENLRDYLERFSKLTESEKSDYLTYANLQGRYKTNDRGFYKKFIFEGKSTVTVIDAFFGMPFTTSYVLDGKLIRIKTDKSDLLLKIKNENTLIGQGFANGTFYKY